MSFIGSMFSNSNGSGYDASSNQNSAQGQASAQQAAQLGGVNQSLQNEATNGSALATNQLLGATAQNIQNAQGMISSQKGLNPALAARTGLEAGAQANQTAANQSAQLQAQTQMAAQQQLSSNLLGQQQVYQGSLANQNNNQTTIAAGNQKTQAGIFGGLENGAGAVAAMASGGRVMLANGTPDSSVVASPTLPPATNPVAQTGAPLSSAAKFMKGFSAANKPQQGQDPVYNGTSNLVSGLAKRAGVGSKSSNPPAPAPGTVNNPIPEAVVQPGALPVAPPAANASNASPIPEAAMADGGDVESDIASGDGSGKAPADDSSSKGSSAGVGQLVGALAMAKGGNTEERKKSIARIIAAHQKKHGAVVPQTQNFNGNESSLASTSQSLAPQSAMLAKGGKVPALLSPGERYLPPSEAAKVVHGKKDAMKAGKKVPGKPAVGGAKNSYANDTVPATLETGGIVIPRSVTQQKDPQMAAHAFVAAHFQQKGGLPGKKKAK